MSSKGVQFKFLGMDDPPLAPPKPKHPPLVIDHNCIVCGQFGAFGFGVSFRLRKPGVFTCFAHVKAGEAHLAANK